MRLGQISRLFRMHSALYLQTVFRSHGNARALEWLSHAKMIPKRLWMALKAFCVTALVASASGPCGPALAQDQVEIIPLQSLTFPGNLFGPAYVPPGEEGIPAAIFALLRVPAGTARVPAVGKTHGCSGLIGAETWWGRHLRQLGIATFIINSFVGRGISRVCSGVDTIGTASLLTDVYRAREMLTAHPRVDGSPIAVLGFSLGGRTAVLTSHPRFRHRYGSASLPFVAHLAFYPTSCHIKLADEDHITKEPVRIFHGADDERRKTPPGRSSRRLIRSPDRHAPETWAGS